MSTVSREAMISTMRSALEELSFVEAAWLGGSAAFGREDQYSDIDIQVLADHAHASKIFEQVEVRLSRLAPIAMRWEIPLPTWHGNPQALYRLQGVSPFNFIDFCILDREHLQRFRDPVRHGQPVVLFDRYGQLEPLHDDRQELRERIGQKLAEIRQSREVYRALAEKDSLRANPPEAVSGYVLRTLRTLATVLRIRHCPERFDFNERYLQFDLPAANFAEVAELYLFSGLAELESKRVAAEALIDRTLAEIEREGVTID